MFISDICVRNTKRAAAMFPAAALAMVLIWNMGLTAYAEEAAGIPYSTTIAALKADAPGQRLIVAVQDAAFETTMAELGETAVAVQDNADGSRLCHIPDTSVLDAFLSEINTALSGVPAGDAFYYYDTATGTFQTCPAVSYYQISEAGKQMIYLTLLEMLADKGTADRTVVMEETALELVSPEIPEEIALNRYSVKGSCITSMKGSSANRISNIQIAASNINQLVLYPGQEVSMNTAFRPRTSANGYREAGAYLNGKVVQALGGGICQVSSTVYNAAMNSGLTILERHPHSMPVHYLPLGMDAAISSGSKDLRIRNDYPFPVLFEAYTEGKNLTVNIYTNELLTAGTSYRLHAVSKGSLAANTYLEVSAGGTVIEDRFIGSSRYNPMLPDDEED